MMLAFEVLMNSNTAIALANILGTILSFIYFGVYKISRMEVKVDTMWAFQMRRGLTEVELKGIGVTNSPVSISEHANEVIAPLVPALKRIYDKVGGDKAEVIDLAVAIERELGPRLAEEVCPKLNLNDGACLVLAIAQLRPIGYQTISHTLHKPGPWAS